MSSLEKIHYCWKWSFKTHFKDSQAALTYKKGHKYIILLPNSMLRKVILLLKEWALLLMRHASDISEPFKSCSFMESILPDCPIAWQISNSDLAKLIEIPGSLRYFRDNFWPIYSAHCFLKGFLYHCFLFFY